MSRTAPSTERSTSSSVAAGTGAALRARREELGYTLAGVSRVTHIPIQHLLAMEADRFDQLPAGPYAAAYLKAVEDHYGSAVPVGDDAPPPLAPAGLPLAFVRLIALSSVVAMGVAIGVSYHARWTPPSPTAPELPAAPLPDQHVVVTTRRTVDLRVRVDGKEVLARDVAGGEKLTFDAFDEVEIELPALDAVKFEFNGETIVPQGRQDVSRRLVFADASATGGGG